MRSHIATLALSLLLLGSSITASAKPEAENEAKEVDPFAAVDLENFDSPSIPHLELRIKSKNFDKLLAKRNHALKQNTMISSADDYVSASINLGDKKAKVKMRLKGDYVEHLEGAKWSFRVKVKGDNTIMGMKVFSLQHPKMRLFLHEWLIHKALAYEDLIALRYHFVKLSINGKYLGIFNLEEHFEKRLVENNARREGPILKFDEAPLFDLINQDIYDGAIHDNDLFFNADILPFQKKKTTENATQKELFGKAAELLDAFRKGNARVSDVFNIEQFAKYYAISDVFMGKHGNRWHNQRFYFNPINSRLEPIGFDFNDDKAGLDFLSAMNRENGLFYGTNWAFDVFSRMLFSDPEFFAAYKKHADRISQKSYMDKFFRSVEKDANSEVKILAKEFNTKEFSKYIYFNKPFKDAYYKNQSYVRKSLVNKGLLRVYLKGAQPGFMNIVYDNQSEHLLEVFEYIYNGKVYPIKNPRHIHSFRFYHRHIGSTQNISNAKIKTPPEPIKEQVTFRYRILGGKEVFETPIITGKRPPSAPKPHVFASIKERGHPTRTHSNWKEFPFLRQTGNKIVGIQGSWSLDKTLILPKGVNVEFPAGMQIDLKNKASIISRSPLSSLGTQENPVKFFSSDKTGGGIFVYNAGELSTWTYTEVSDLSNPTHEEWKPTGAVTFFKSPLKASHNQFKSNRSEDGLNTINTNIVLTGNYFSDTFSDAFDADFCSGKLTENTFVDIGNDAVDVSGSQITIYDLKVTNAGDKGVSAGERSNVYLENFDLKHSTIGMASKDSSLLIASKVKLHDTTIAMCAYQKKPEYALPTIHAKDVEILTTELPVVLQDNALVTIDSKVVSNPLGKKQNLLIDSLRNGQKLN